jgi:hypothetical protein
MYSNRTVKGVWNVLNRVTSTMRPRGMPPPRATSSVRQPLEKVSLQPTASAQPLPECHFKVKDVQHSVHMLDKAWSALGCRVPGAHIPTFGLSPRRKILAFPYLSCTLFNADIKFSICSEKQEDNLVSQAVSFPCEHNPAPATPSHAPQGSYHRWRTAEVGWFFGEQHK